MAFDLDSLKKKAAPAPIPTHDISIGFETVAGFEALQRMAKTFAFSPITPDTFRAPYMVKGQSKGCASNDEAIGACAIALDMALRMKCNPLMTMQNLYVVHGRPAWSAKFLLATLLKSGRYNGIRYEFSGTEGKDDWGCTLVAIEVATGMEIKGPRITIALAKAEGWYGKPGSKWQTMAEMMLRYRAVSWFVQSQCPDIAMGLPEAEEARDIIDITPVENEDVPEIPTTTAKEIASKAKRGRKPKQIETAPEEESVAVAPAAPLPEELPVEAPQEGPTDEELYAALPNGMPSQDEPGMIECPDRDGDKVSETFCRSGCRHYSNRTCPQWDWGI